MSISQQLVDAAIEQALHRFPSGYAGAAALAAAEGLDLHLAVLSAQDPSQWGARRLRHVQPCFWRQALQSRG